MFFSSREPSLMKGPHIPKSFLGSSPQLHSSSTPSLEVKANERATSIRKKFKDDLDQPTLNLMCYLKLYSTCWQYSKESFLLEFQKLLANHANPNKCDRNGIHPLWWIIVYFDLDFLMLALAYKAHPLLVPEERHMKGLPLSPTGFDPKAPIEYANVPGRMDKYDFIVRLCTRPQASLKTPMQVESYQIDSKDGCINIHFKANNKPIRTSIQSTKKLSRETIALIYNKYKKYFKGSPTLRGTLDNFFNHEIQGKHKFVELLFCGEEFIGMNLHKLIRDPRYPDYHSHYISCAYVQEELRSLGLSDPLMMTLAALMPKLFDLKIIIGSFQAIFIGAANLLKGLDCFPQYSSEFLRQYANDHFEHVQEASECDPNPVLVNDREGECHSALPVRPVVDLNKSVEQLSLGDWHFNWMRGINGGDLGLLLLSSYPLLIYSNDYSLFEGRY